MDSSMRALTTTEPRSAEPFIRQLISPLVLGPTCPATQWRRTLRPSRRSRVITSSVFDLAFSPSSSSPWVCLESVQISVR